MSVVAKVGDLFMIPIDRESFGVGLVAEKWKSELYLVVFKERFDNSHNVSDIRVEALTPIFASSSLDAKIWHGHWPIVREGVDVSFLAKPVYKVEEPSGIVAESFDRHVRRLIDDNVAKRLSYRKGVAPVRLENALKAHFGILAWDPVFEELRYEKIVGCSKVLAE